MYCPVCFNSTLKIAHSGVVKVAINGKSKSTSQFIYNLKNDKQDEINQRLKNVLVEYFEWYKTLQNRDLIKTVSLTSCDFVCSDGCRLNLNHMLNVIGLVIPIQDYKDICSETAANCDIDLKLELQRQL